MALAQLKPLAGTHVVVRQYVGPRLPMTPDLGHVRERLEHLVGRMRAAERWPWKGAVLALYREDVLPQLCEELPAGEEASRWRAEIEAESARLDAAQ
jgi:hypothetical protein